MSEGRVGAAGSPRIGVTGGPPAAQFLTALQSITQTLNVIALAVAPSDSISQALLNINETLAAILAQLQVQPPASTPAIDGSGTILVGGAAQFIFGGIKPVHGYLVQNISNDVLYISDIAPASIAAGFLLNPAAIFVTPQGYITPGPVSILGATAGQNYIARRW